MVTPGGLEPPAYGLGNRRSILLSYGVTRELLPDLPAQFQHDHVLSGFPGEQGGALPVLVCEGS